VNGDFEDEHDDEDETIGSATKPRTPNSELRTPNANGERKPDREYRIP